MITFRQKQYRINIIATLCICAIIGLTPLKANAETIRTEEIYKFAQENDIKKLKLHKKDIDIINSDGNTAYCLALKDKEEKIAKLLEKEGANTKHKCVAAVLSANKTFLGMSKTTWGWLGALVGGGAVAAAAGGSGGSGGNSSSENGGNDEPEEPEEPVILDCKNGTQQGDKCICKTGYTGILCDDVADGYVEIGGKVYPKLNCQNGGTQTGETCSCKEGWEGKTCETAQACAEYTYTSCPTGYVSTATCQSGATIKYKCENCADGYIKQDGQCYKELECQNGGKQNADKCECSAGYTGDRCESCASGYYKDGNQCKQQDKIAHCTSMTPNANTCATCEMGYTGNKCESCATGYYKNGNQCLKQDNIAHCTAMTPNANTCATCETGYTGDKCESCTTGYYKDGNQCLKQDNIAHCTAMTPNANTCATCEMGYTGDRCESCTTGYIAENGFCYLDLKCQNGGTQQGDKCICTALFSGDRCQNTLCAGKIIDGKCIAKNDSSNNSEITMDIQGNIIDEYGNNLSAVGLYSENSPIYNAYGENSVGLIKITNNGKGDVYGIYANDIAYNEYYYASSYYKTSNSKATIDIINKSDNNVYGIYSTQKIFNSYYTGNTTQYINGTGIIKITNIGSGLVYGLYSKSDAINAYGVQASNATYQGKATQTGKILIQNTGDSNVYGIYSLSNSYNAYTDKAGKTNGIIQINNKGNGLIFGMYGSSVNNAYCVYHSDNSLQSAIGKIFILNTGTGNAYGIFSKTMSNSGSSIINMANLSSGLAVGSYSTSSAENSGDITIHNLGEGTAVGMYANGGTATNSGNITITRADYIDNNLTEDDTSDDVTCTASSATGGKAIGIYGANGAKITNSGTITIDGVSEAYGIYAEAGATVTNTGTIIINGVSCDKTTCSGSSDYGNYIKLNGGKLFQDGKLISTESINLAAMNGDIIASATTEIVTPEALSGTLKMNSNIVTSGFERTYTTKDTVQAGDTSGLKLQSQSAMFGAQLAENGSDVNLTMKSFNDVVKNQSLAAFLEQNYTAKNNETLFSNIKSVENLAALNNNLDELMGKDMFSRFAFEDFTIMRELNFDINNKLFNNTEDYISVGGSTSSFAFSGNSRYSLTNMKNGKRSMGISVAFSDVNSDDGNNHNRRYDRMYNISMPMGYQTNGFNLVTTPRIGYSYGTYDRRGFNRQNYDGTVEKQMFALMNEARYPLQLGGWTVSPSVELNFMDYRISGHETAKDYALNIKAQDNYSIEAGFGLYANKETELSKNSSLNFNSGVALYHEFADPYKMKLGMQGMDGTFTLRDENRSDNRAVVRTGFEFNYDNISVAGNVMSYIDREYQTNATLDFKFGF